MASGIDLDSSLLMESAWMDVLQKMDETYSDLLAYQVELEKKNADLESMRQFMESVLGAMTDILIVCDRAGHVLQVNRAVVQELGQDPGRLEGAPIEDLFAPASAAALQDLLKRSARRRTVGACELVLAGRDGEIPIEVQATPRLDARGRVVGVVLIGRPVGEVKRAYARLADAHEQLKAAQTQLVHSEKMASLGRLVSGVAHELNNPISFVYGNAHAVERYVGRLEAYFQKVWSGAPREELIALREELNIDRAVSRMRQAISGALEGAERVRDIVESLRRFSADGRGQSERFDLVGAVQTAIGWVIKGRDRNFVLRADVPDRLDIVGRSGHIQQVVMNVVQNACDSIEGQAEQIVAVTIRRDGPDAVISIADNGPGIGEEARGKLFEPFFTTKPVGKGTGLGLSISYKIVDEHAGRLSAGNTPEGGAVFTIRLPVAGPPAARADAAPVPAERP